MRLASYLVEGAEAWGFVLDEPATGQEWVMRPGATEGYLTTYASIPSSGLVAARPRFRGDEWPATLAGFLALGDEGMAVLSNLAAYVERFVDQVDATLLPRAGHRVDDVELLAPIPRPRLHWGLVTNAPSFVRNNPKVASLNLFPLGHQRPQGAVIGAGQPVTMKHRSHMPLMAYNVELAVVIGKGGRYIPMEQAMAHVAGYTVVTDAAGTYYYSAVPGNEGRGFALPDGYGDWLFQATASWGGKKADTLSPMGPYLVTKDEVGDPYNLLMYTRQSGRTRDRAHSGAAILGIERVIAWYSSFATLHPGDVIHFATMGVDGLPLFPDDLADPQTRLESEIEHIGVLSNPVRVADGGSSPSVPPLTHPSYAVREVANSDAREIASPDAWSVETTRHFYTSFGNHETAPEAEELARLEVPRFLNGPASSLSTRRSVEVPPRATDLEVAIELAVVIRELVSETEDGYAAVLGYTPMVSLCDSSFAEAVVEPARAGERGIPAVYGRWADGFNVVREAPVMLAEHDWRNRSATLEIGDRSVNASTSEYVAGPDELIRTISRMITLFPGDVITLGATRARIRIPRAEYTAGVVVRGGIEGLGEVSVKLGPAPEITRAAIASGSDGRAVRPK